MNLSRFRTQLDVNQIFIFFWFLAIIAHNDGRGLSIHFSPYFFSTLLAYVALCFSRSTLIVLAGLISQILAAWNDMPIIDNHYFFMTIVSILLTLIFLIHWIKDNFKIYSVSPNIERTFPTIRGLVILLYIFAVFHKLNFDFFDPNVSCVNYWYETIISKSYLINLPAEISNFWMTIIIGFILITELAIAILLINRKTWFGGLALGIIFHLLTHIRHFPSAMFALYFLFIPKETRKLLLTYLDTTIKKFSFRTLNLIEFLKLQGFIFTCFTFYFMYVYRNAENRLLDNLWVWIVTIIFIYMFNHILKNKHQTKTIPKQHKDRPVLKWTFWTLFLLNCIMPYLGYKTCTSMGMYSNLLVVNYMNNHMIMQYIPMRIFKNLDDFVIILDSNVPDWKEDYIEIQQPVHFRDLKYGIHLADLKYRKRIYIKYIRNNKVFVSYDAAKDSIHSQKDNYFHLKTSCIYTPIKGKERECSWL